ncbi:TolB family protein [Sphingobacterium haloxyli]|uniref:Dipeptidylpeptidase IV N-terminal domain-containing protein n=1 Tax=Sphingobacterium haloxyli TaxID=2100533 RepID=A0A2S9J6X6_9SPHI|nr:hypothetical protein [Sphingobacterium haloxyli]PRD48489.1 hypothetical protein C5745_04615 [Sphingobacterium haloxyli]
MKNVNMSFLLSVALFFNMTGCSKNDGSAALPVDEEFSGILLYDSGEHTYKLDLSSKVRSIYFDRNTYSLNGWDVSWDASIRLESEIVAGEFDDIKFKLINTADNSVVKEFVYDSPNGEDRQISGLLSPDKSLILIQPDFEHGIVIIDTEGQVKHHLPKVNNTKLTLGDEVIWSSNNSILFTFEEFILRSDPPYTSITTVKELNYSDWGNIHTSADGSKISLRIDKHIYLMNADGTDLVQVTESDREEREAVFSPDGRYLLVAADYYPSTFHPGRWDLNIIPADGSKYKVGKSRGNGVLEIRRSDSKNVETASNQMLWR